MASPFKKIDGRIVLDVESCEFYIPKSYFDSALGHMGVNTANVFGLFDVIFYGPNKKELERRVLNLPTMITINVPSYKNGTIKIAEEDTPCTVVEYLKGETIMQSKVVVDSTNAQTYLNMVLKSKVPKNVPYSSANELWTRNQELNKVNFGVPSYMRELIVSVTYRDPNNPSKKFATVIGKNPNVLQTSYILMNIRQICQYTSTYTGITFEDMNSMITTSINRSKSKTPDTVSPVEKIIKY